MSGEQSDKSAPSSPWLTWLGLALLAAVSLPPLWLEPKPVDFVARYALGWQVLGKAAIVAGMLAAFCLRGWWDRGRDPNPGRTIYLLTLIATLMTLWHWFTVDTWSGYSHLIRGQESYAFEDRYVERWQRQLCLDILNRGPEPIPHVYRPLPYGFARTLERLTGDWKFACFSSRWFFYFWFLWAYFRLARRFLPLRRAWFAVGIFLVLFPLSVWHYKGQLTDPMSHALFALALWQVVENDWLALGPTLALGVLAKETVGVVVLAYWLCYWRQGYKALARSAVLGLCCAAAFLAARLPLGWVPGTRTMSGIPESMIWNNLGFGDIEYRSTIPLAMGYIQTALFFLPFVPFIVRNWRRADYRLKVLYLTLAPLLIGSNLAFSWFYESRNYVPLLPVMATMALLGPGKREVDAADERGKKNDAPGVVPVPP